MANQEHAKTHTDTHALGINPLTKLTNVVLHMQKEPTKPHCKLILFPGHQNLQREKGTRKRERNLRRERNRKRGGVEGISQSWRYFQSAWGVRLVNITSNSFSLRHFLMK